MSAHPQNHQNWSLLGETMVTKCIMEASLQKSHQKVTNMSKIGLKKGLVFRAADFRKPSLEASWSHLGLKSDSEVLQGAKMSPGDLQNEPQSDQKCSQECVRITLGSPLAFQLAILTQGRRVPRSE